MVRWDLDARGHGSVVEWLAIIIEGDQIMPEKRGRGFASMDEAKQRAIASKGGKAAHQKGTAHEFTPEEARVAGRKGGQVAHSKGTAHRFTSEEAREAGRKGGLAARDRGQLGPAIVPESLNGTVGEPVVTVNGLSTNGQTGQVHLNEL
jgi:general stress protein YciG